MDVFFEQIIPIKKTGKTVALFLGIWVLAAVTIGGSAFGFIGMLIGVPVCSVIYCLLKESTNNRLAEKEATEKAALETQKVEAELSSPLEEASNKEETEEVNE